MYCVGKMGPAISDYNKSQIELVMIILEVRRFLAKKRDRFFNCCRKLKCHHGQEMNLKIDFANLSLHLLKTSLKFVL